MSENHDVCPEVIHHDLYCPSCGVASHPASGCAYSETYIVCGRCVREAWRWIKGHTNILKRVGTQKSKEDELMLSQWEDDGGSVYVEKKIFASFYEAAGRK